MNSVEEIEQIAYIRLAEAKVLSREGMYNAAFYLLGYSVELMLKSKICEHLGVPNLFQSREVGPQPEREVRELANFCRTHDLLKLLLLAGLKNTYLDENPDNEMLGYGLGSFISQWSIDIRYTIEPIITQVEIEALLSYIEDETNGILQWIKSR